MHKFCTSCIEEYTRKFKKSCPGCRHEIGSRRLLKPDFRLSGISKFVIAKTHLVGILIRDVDEFNRHEQVSRVEQVQSSFDFEGFNEKMRKVQDHQAAHILAS